MFGASFSSSKQACGLHSCSASHRPSYTRSFNHEVLVFIDATKTLECRQSRAWLLANTQGLSMHAYCHQQVFDIIA